MNVQLVGEKRLGLAMAAYHACVVGCVRATRQTAYGETVRALFPDGTWVRHRPGCAWGLTDRPPMDGAA